MCEVKIINHLRSLGKIAVRSRSGLGAVDERRQSGLRADSIGFIASDGENLIANLETEVSGFENPVAVVIDEGKIVGREGKGDRLALSGLEFNLRELAQATDIWGRGGYQIGREEEDCLLASASARVLDIDRDG